ncbi:MAG: DUF2304 domain-containing protein [Candidatus Woesearchaeota archaeon]
MILGIQILGILFALFMMYLSFMYRKRNEFDSGEYAFWLILWIVFILVTLFPGVLDPITKTLSLPRTMDLIILVGFIFIMGLTFQNYASLRKSQRKMEGLVRRMAFKEKEK